MTTTSDLQAFCDPTYSRCKMPFVRAGHTYATDARVCIRIPTEEADTEGKFPDTHRLGWSGCALANEPWPNIEVNPIEHNCDECYGTGKAEEDCDRCRGAGWLHCHHCDNESDCKKCDGDGVVVGDSPCEECGGTGKRLSLRDVHVSIGSATISGHYHKLIAALPNARVTLPTEPCDMLSFRFDGGEGLLMAIRGDSP